MPLRNGQAVSFKPLGVCDATDGSNAKPGSLQAAVNLVPSLHTRNQWQCRPAIVAAIDFAQLNGETGQVEALVEIGDRVWGMVQSNVYPGQSTPFCYDFTLGGFVPLAGIATGNLPASTSNAGAWQPPSITQIGAFLIFTHPGFSLPNAFGWIDMTGLTDNTGGTLTISSPVITALDKDVLLAGWRPGMLLTGDGLPAGARIASVSVDGTQVTMSAPAGVNVASTNISVTGGTPGNPLWGAGNTNANPLVAVPAWCSMFNGRAWYAVNNAEVFSDAGDPLQVTNADQALTIQNGLGITCSATQPFANQTLLGGVVQALILFQGDAAIWQITGDQATQNLALNYVAQIGTQAPLTIQSVPGSVLRFIAPDGPRQINLDGTLSDPLGTEGDGVALPFILAPFPSRMCAAYNEDVYRVSATSYITVGGSPIPTLASADYWFHEKLKAWSGPHTCPANLICASNRVGIDHGFILAPQNLQPILATGIGLPLGTGITGLLATGGGATTTTLYFSNTRPMIDTVYVENGAELTWAMQSVLLPDTGNMFICAMVETALALGMAPGGMIQVTALDELGVVLDQVAVNGFAPVPGGTQLPAVFGDIWGPATSSSVMIWNQGIWGRYVGGAILAQRQVDWHQTLTFKQMSLMLAGVSDPNTLVGNMYLRLQRSGYMLTDPANMSVA